MVSQQDVGIFLGIQPWTLLAAVLISGSLSNIDTLRQCA